MKIKNRKISLPNELTELIDQQLLSRRSSLKNSRKLAESVLFLSDFYIHNPHLATPWEDTKTWQAQLAYYFPLNLVRNLSVIRELKKFLSLNHFSQIIDYGSGLGTSAWAFHFEGFKSAIYQLEKNISLKNFWSQDFIQWLDSESEMEKKIDSRSLGVFSYSLTELNNPITLLEKFNYLLIIEPSLKSDGRELLKLRQQLIDKNYFIVAPCTHQSKCPLLESSEKDWCHDRVHFEKPTWFQQIETFLPIKNDTLTFSFLIAAKKNNDFEKNYQSIETLFGTEGLVGRLTGDLLTEKGKSRQLFCHSEKRVFLSWLHRFGKPEEIGRGELIKITSAFKEVENEYRLSEGIEILNSQ